MPAVAPCRRSALGPSTAMRPPPPVLSDCALLWKQEGEATLITLRGLRVGGGAGSRGTSAFICKHTPTAQRELRLLFAEQRDPFKRKKHLNWTFYFKK